MKSLGTTQAKQSWPVVRLGDVCTVQRGVRVTRKNLNEFGRYNVFQNSLKPLGRFDSFNCEANNPFVIMALAAGEVGFSTQPFWAADDCTYFTDLKNLDCKYLYFILLKSKRELRRNVKQTTIPRLSNKYLECLLIPLPPLPVQREIVARLERELAEADRLAANFKRIAELADAEFKAELDELFIGFKGSRIRLEEVAKIERGRSKYRPRNAPYLYGGPYPFVQTGDVKYYSGGVIAAYEQTYSEAGLKQSRLWKKGTLCVTIAANIGEAAILGFDACFPDSIVGVIPNENVIPQFLNYYFYYVKESMFTDAIGVAQKNFNVERMCNLKIPLLSIQTQTSVISQLDAAKTRNEHLKTSAEKGLRAAEALRAAILSEAFTQ